MCRRTIVFLMSLLILAATGGCGAITAATVIKKGGMWLAKEAVKKGYKEFKAQHDEGDTSAGDDETSRERGHQAHHRSKHHD